MDAAQVEGSSPLLDLPVEVFDKILHSIDSPRSLFNFVLSSHNMYNLFKRSEQIAIRHVLTNLIGMHTLPEAALVYKCRPPNPYMWMPRSEKEEQDRMKYASDFATKLQRPTRESLKFNLRDGLNLEATHHYVATLRDGCIKMCERAKTGISMEESLSISPPSPSEIGRIDRALYRFEMFRKLFRGLDTRFNFFRSDDKEPDSVRDFFLRFAPWENAQLGCIHDLLFYQVIPGTLFNSQQSFIHMAYFTGY